MVLKQPTSKQVQPEEHGLEVHRAALDALPEPVFLLDQPATTLSPLNAAAERWRQGMEHGGDGEIEVAACFPELDWEAVLAAPGRSWFTHAIPKAPGKPHDVELHVYPLADSPRQIVVVRTITAIAGDEGPHHAAIANNSFHDPLTGLPNRRLFARRLERAIQRAGRRNYHFAVLFVDLDHFKSLNNRFGHLHGDQVLTAVGCRLQETVRPQDMVARRDGDEFTVLLDDLEHPNDAEGVAQRIVEQLQKPLVIPGCEMQTGMTIGASIGIALSGEALQTADELIARADSAMYHAKALGGGTYMMLEHGGEKADFSFPVGKPRPR